MPEVNERLRLTVGAGTYALCRLVGGDPVPVWAWGEGFVSVTRIGDELSIVCLEDRCPPGTRALRGLRCVAVDGPLDLTLVGILAGLAATLAAASVSVLSIGTFDTDYLFIRDEQLHTAVRALTDAGYEVRSS